MKCLEVFVVFALVFVCFYTDADETDVVRVFDPDLRMSKEELFDMLKKADLEAYGFKKTTERAIETDENGKKKVKETIRYMATAECSRTMILEGVLEQRLPGFDPKSLNLGKTFVREVQSRIKQRGTKYCEIGLEIHLNRCRQPPNQQSKRGNCNWWCFFCWSAKVVY